MTAPGDDQHVRATDVVTFGHETGRIMSDGRIVGRPEPFAKVFASSRAVKRAVGVTAWAILEDIALDARLDVEGRLVADTNVRRIADNLALSKNTVAAHLAKLRDYGFVLHEERRNGDTGRYNTSRYVLDPAACLERFTHTPTDPHTPDSPQGAPSRPAPSTPPLHDHPDAAPEDDHTPTREPSPSPQGDDAEPCPKNWDTDQITVSQSTGHGELGHKNKDLVVLKEQQHARETTPAEPGEPPGAATATELDRLLNAGVKPDQARKLAQAHPPARLHDVCDAVAAHDVTNVAGWIVAALIGQWDVHASAHSTRQHRTAQRRRHRRLQREQADHDVQQRRDHVQRARADAWANYAAAILNDDQLVAILDLHDPDDRLPHAMRTSPRLLQAHVTTWLASAISDNPHLDPQDAVQHTLHDPNFLPTTTDPLPPPQPHDHTPQPTLRQRIAHHLTKPELAPPAPPQG